MYLGVFRDLAGIRIRDFPYTGFPVYEEGGGGVPLRASKGKGGPILYLGRFFGPTRSNFFCRSDALYGLVGGSTQPSVASDLT